MTVENTAGGRTSESALKEFGAEVLLLWILPLFLKEYTLQDVVLLEKKVRFEV